MKKEQRKARENHPHPRAAMKPARKMRPVKPAPKTAENAKKRAEGAERAVEIPYATVQRHVQTARRIVETVRGNVPTGSAEKMNPAAIALKIVPALPCAAMVHAPIVRPVLHVKRIVGHVPTSAATQIAGTMRTAPGARWTAAHVLPKKYVEMKFATAMKPVTPAQWIVACARKPAETMRVEKTRRARVVLRTVATAIVPPRKSPFL